GGSCPRSVVRVVSPAGVQNIRARNTGASAPDNHFTARPHCGVSLSPTGGISGVSSRPTVGSRIISPAGEQLTHAFIRSAPNYHFTVRPNCRVIKTPIRGTRSASSRPTIGAGIVSPPSVHDEPVNKSAPDYHFTARPHCCVRRSEEHTSELQSLAYL